jgi:hypothetical protein
MNGRKTTMPPKHPDNDPKTPKVRVRWIKKVPRKRSVKREGLLELARQIAAQPRRWALLKVFVPEDRGYKAADQRRFQYSKKDSAFGKVGRFQFAVRFDAGYKGDYETRKQGKTERGAWLLIGRCLEPHKMDEKDPTEWEIEGWEFDDDPEEAMTDDSIPKGGA